MRRLDKIDITYAFEQKEYLRAVQQYLLAGRIVKKRDAVIMPLLLIALVAALFYSHFNKWILLLTVLAFIAILLCCTVYFIKPWYDYTKKTQMREETQLSFTEEGIHMLRGTVDSQVGWDIFTEAWENREFFYLINQPRIYSIIPKRAFANPEEQQYFLKMLYRRVGAVESVGPYQRRGQA